MSRVHSSHLGTPIGAATLIAYTPTIVWAGNTIGTQSGFYLKTPGKLEVWVAFTETAGTAGATLTCTIPSGFTAITHTASLETCVGTMCSVGFTVQAMQALAGATSTIKTAGAVVGGVGTWTIYASIPTIT